MAMFNHKTQTEVAPFKERRVKGRIVAFNADIVAEHAPSPALAPRCAAGSAMRRRRSTCPRN